MSVTKTAPRTATSAAAAAAHTNGAGTIIAFRLLEPTALDTTSPPALFTTNRQAAAAQLAPSNHPNVESTAGVMPNQGGRRFAGALLSIVGTSAAGSTLTARTRIQVTAANRAISPPWTANRISMAVTMPGNDPLVPFGYTESQTPGINSTATARGVRASAIQGRGLTPPAEWKSAALPARWRSDIEGRRTSRISATSSTTSPPPTVGTVQPQAEAYKWEFEPRPSELSSRGASTARPIRPIPKEMWTERSRATGPCPFHIRRSSNGVRSDSGATASGLTDSSRAHVYLPNIHNKITKSRGATAVTISWRSAP